MKKWQVKTFKVNLDDEKQSEKIIKALDCKTRRDILRLLARGSYTIYGIAEQLNVPLSTISEHVKVLCSTGIISVFGQKNDRGHAKMVTRQYEDILISVCSNTSSTNIKSYSQHVPIGSYSNFDINQYCGMLGEEGYIGDRDNKNSFYTPIRFTAQLIWFDMGFLEYLVPIQTDKDAGDLISLSISLEICSEAPGYNENFKSDIFFEINGIEVATYTSPGDYGARHGRITPNWWQDGTQYGILKNLEINNEGTFIDGNIVSPITLNDLNLFKKEVVPFKFGVKKDAKNRGGLNLFGRKFGDHAQHIIFTVSYKT